MELKECIEKDLDACNHRLHIGKNLENDLSAISQSINGTSDVIFNYLSLIFNKVDKIEKKIEKLKLMENLDLNNETKMLLIQVN